MSRRLEDHRFLTGAGRYVGDLVEPDDLHAHFYRSPVAHGVLGDVDIEAAANAPGVVAVLTSVDLDLPPIPGGHLADEGFDRPLLATGKVRYVGEPIAAVVARSKVAAVDASDLIWAEIDFLDPVTSVRDALDGPSLFDVGNMVRRSSTGSELASGQHEVSTTVSVENQRLAPSAIEGLAIRAEPSARGLSVWCGHQAPHRLRSELAEQLGVSADAVRVIVPDVGGAFGLKGMLFPEYVVVAATSLRLGRPVVWLESRKEHFLGGVHGRSQNHTVTLEGDGNGRIRRARIEILADVGAYPHSGALMPSLSTYVAQGLYDIDELSVDATTVVTNLAPVGSYRGAGRPEAAFAMERAIDAFAREAGLDPVDVRRKNFIRSHQFPYDTQTGARYDSGDYSAALDKALEIVDIEWARREHQLRLSEGGNPIGIGIGAFVERAGGATGTGEFGAVSLDDEGVVTVRSGSTSAGQGHETVWAELAAARFGVDRGEVRVISGDTQEVAHGVGTFASRSGQLGGSAIDRTASRLVERIKDLAAGVLEVSSEDLVADGGRIHVIGDVGSGVSFAELARQARDSGQELEEAEMFVPDNQAFPYGVHVAVVEVSIETGEVRILRYAAVDDCGVVLNPMIVEGQVVGSLAQGYGQAMLEGIEYSESGDPLTSSFMDYLLPAAADTPTFTLGRTYHPAPSNPLGVKGTGEAGCIGAPPAIVNAAIDALTPWGVTDLKMPLRPHRVWEAIMGARSPGRKETDHAEVPHPDTREASGVGG